ncbi:hypothetical protein [Kistimonas scapharcae]|uniref:hypothetical protein n=1 Tax=Kistimonas scapharcae TaxID=1036133 RepID=UPI0031F13B8C
MAKIIVTDDDVRWLRKHHASLSYKAMAKHMQCCVDTLKRILARHGIEQFDGAKYQPRLRDKTWRRPCIICKTTVVRPKNQYICTSCRNRQRRDDLL